MDPTASPAVWTALYETEQLISAKTFDLRRTARSCLDLAMQMAGAEAGFMATYDRGRELVLVTSRGVDEADLRRDYRSKVDPRLNYSQALEMALLITRRLRARRNEG